MDKLIVTVEALGNHTFKISMEDDNVVTSVVTTSPILEVNKFLKEMGVKGKRGPKGSHKPKIFAPDKDDQGNEIPGT